jgi:hypothetical protein
MPAVASATTCTAPALAQVYSWAQDTNWYAALPGESWDSIGTSGWTLSGGAKFVATTMADGKKGTLLDLPSGSQAVSPTACVTNSYPAARTQVRDVTGTAGVNISVAYQNTNGTWGLNQLSATAGAVKSANTGWMIPLPFNIKPSNVTGWQLARFTLAAQGTSSEYQISNLYVDPRMH